MILGLIRERKQPADRRVALSPEQAGRFTSMYPNCEILVESSPDRIFSDEAYRQAGIQVVEDLSHCDVLLGIKEVPVDALISNKTYLFFSHTHKFQEYNKPLLKAAIEKKIRLIDYECLEWPEGGRILGFGRWAGIVGVYNGFRTWGTKWGIYELEPAYSCCDYGELLERIRSIEMPPLRVALTGSGRVASGALELLRALELIELSPEEYLHEPARERVFTRLVYPDLYELRKGYSVWSDAHFYHNHSAYRCIVEPYLRCTDMLINGMYWERGMDPLFSREDTAANNFRVKVIADISCDVEGSVPITLRATDMYKPVLGWDPRKQMETEPYKPGGIDVMAVSNLPAEIPADASRDFGESMLSDVLPLLCEGDEHGILKAATISEGGQLTDKFLYLHDFAYG